MTSDIIKIDAMNNSQNSLNLNALGMELEQKYGFLGVPSSTFEEAGKTQFIALLEEGLMPHSKVLEIGCGVLRVGYWLIHFLNEDGYYGVEPAEKRVEIGKKYLFDATTLETKKPKFSFNEDFDSDIFNQKFDYFLAGSIWTHCSKQSIELMLDGFVRNSNKNGVFLTSYLPARHKGQDYLGDKWMGTSHVSDVSGCIRHSKKWIKAQCRSRNLVVEQLSREAFDSQYWLRISRDKKERPNWPLLRAIVRRIRQRFS